MKRFRFITVLASLLFALCVPFTAVANENVRGDLNQDGNVDVGDVTALIGAILNGNYVNPAVGDINRDGNIDVADVTALIHYILAGQWPDEPQHKYVDLGLPSGTLWATCNVGASAPEGYGDYFAWGETSPKEIYKQGTYKWCKGTYDTMMKYCTQSFYGYNGFTDGKTELDPEDDAAYVNWGPTWRMPSMEQQWELVEQCTWTWTTRNGVDGQLVTGPNGNTIFLPAAGNRWDSSLDSEGTWGDYWSRTLYASKSSEANYLYFNLGSVNMGGCGRFYGFVVRAVRIQ